MIQIISCIDTTCRFISKWMALLVLAVAAGAITWPEFFGLIHTSWISTLLGLVMFGMGLTLQWDDFKVVFSRPRDVLLGCLAQFTIMPLLAWSLSYFFQLPTELAIGVILVGCCPGGTSSNVITFLAGGDLALSVGMTGISTLLAPLLTPFQVWLLAGTMVDVDIFALLISIIQVVILPIGLGCILRYMVKGERLQQFTHSYLPALSTIAITMIVASVVAANASRLLSSGAIVIFVVILHNLLGYSCGWLLGILLKMNQQKRIAVSIEVGMQNSGLACSLASQHFSTMALAPIPGAIFSVWHNISGALIARFFVKSKKQIND